MAKSKSKRSKFRFYLHADKSVGPNRTTTDPRKAITYFKRIAVRNKEDHIIARVVHVTSGLLYDTNKAVELEEFVQKIAEPMNAKY